MRAVVFDCDGVIVDSEPLSERAWSTVLGMHGYTPVEGDYAATRGVTSADTEAYFARLVDVPPETDLVADVNLVLQEMFAYELEAFPDAVEAIRTLAAEGIPLAVASSSLRVNLDLKLAKFDLLRYFDVIVAGDEVARGKPAPDLFLAAADGLKVDGSACLAVDDTEVGADAAVAAGMRTVRLARNGELSARHPTIAILDADLMLHWLGVR
jgi:HAD superfamily hydrolase (TIGR01509 family)